MASSPIIPGHALPMRTLTLSMAVMCYLATLALGALMLVEAAVAQWTSGVSGEITVQVRPQSGIDVAAEVAKAMAIIAATPGVRSARELDRREARELLEPWLGEASALEELPIPVLVAVAIDQESPPDLEALERSLAGRVRGVSLDTHRRWQAELMRTASSLRLLAAAILALIAVSAAGLVVFATRSVLDVNRGVVEVLHLVGARDDFIARAVKRRFLWSGLIAGLAGTSGGIVTFALLGTIDAPAGGGLAEASAKLLFAAPDIALKTYGVFLLVPAAATVLSVFTAHAAVMRQLRATL